VIDNVSMRKRSADKLVGYDLVTGDMVSPYGKGTIPDMEFSWKPTVYTNQEKALPGSYSWHFDVRMTNIVDGIFKGKPDGSIGGKRGSSYISGYESPAEGYSAIVSLYRNVRANSNGRGSLVDGNDDEHYLYYFRIRTQTNEMGQITNALYGKIYGRINGRFAYYLNSTPNDRNVEFDPERNLFTNLKSTERVTAP
jgi:hypothetical protein